ncbi:MAG: hypothetical protein Q8T03_04920 [Bacteroidota bacterium]|nr:hypothetical protein [Bacteroidota bacterium]
MIFYLTISEAYSGIFSSQVIDVVKFFEKNINAKIKLVAFISIRDYFLNRSKIKAEMPNAIILPMWPKLRNWKLNKILLRIYCSVYKPKTIIARSVIATNLALLMRDNKNCDKVIYDGRGAIEAEWKEYNVVNDEFLLNEIYSYEKKAILNSDFRIAVSNSLAEFWENKYSYIGNKHVVIPCTLNSDFKKIKLSSASISDKRKQLNLDDSDEVFVYSGSIAGWQSFDLIFSFIEPILKQSSKNKIVFFSPSNSNLDKLLKLFPKQVICKHLNAKDVSDFLIVGDYGLLIREDSITNQVASPVKFAEYLACGLRVVISDKLGDYSKLAVQNNWGYLYTNFNDLLLKPSLTEKQKISEDAINHFSKENYISQYKQLLIV